MRGRPFPGNLRTRKGAGLPPSLAPLVRDPFTAVCRGRACPARSLAIITPFILCIVGRGLDPSAGRRGRRLLQHNPQGFSLPQTSAAAWGQAALHPTLPHFVGRAFARNSFTPPCRGRACPARNPAITTPFILCIVGRGLDPSAGASGTPPPTTIRRASHYRKRPRRPGGRPPYIPLYHISWGGPSPATHSRHPVGAGHARPAASPLPPRILCIVGRQATGPLHNRPAPSNTKITCLRPLAGRLFF